MSLGPPEGEGISAITTSSRLARAGHHAKRRKKDRNTVAFIAAVLLLLFAIACWLGYVLFGDGVYKIVAILATVSFAITLVMAIFFQATSDEGTAAKKFQ